MLFNQFYPPDVAATGQLLADLAEGLVHKGHEVHVLCSRRVYAGGMEKYPAEQLINGVYIHRLAATGFGRCNIVGRLIDYLSFYVLAAWKALILPRMNVCIALTTPPFIATCGLMLRLLKGTRLVLWTMDLYPEIAVAYGVLKKGSLLHKCLARISRWIYRCASVIVSLGEIMTEKLVEAGAKEKKIITVHNWVPGEIVRPISSDNSVLRHEWNLDGHVTLMYSGNLGLGYELDTVVRAMKELGEGANIQMLFVGNGKMQEPLAKLTADFSLDSIKFRPPVPLDNLSDALAAGDIHIVSQRAGTQGLIVPSKLYGILAAGRPVIYIGPEDCEPAIILRRSKGGIIVKPGDVNGVADCLRELAQSPQLRRTMGRCAREYYESNFGRDQSVARIHKAIEAIFGTELPLLGTGMGAHEVV